MTAIRLAAAPQFMLPASHVACHPFRICGLVVRRALRLWLT